MAQKYSLKPKASVSEGDVNLSPQRAAWSAAHIDASTQDLLAQDAQYFLHQSLSSPCLNVLTHSNGIYLEDTQGRQIMDFHGNSVHQVGYGHPKVVDAIKEQLDTLPFCPRRYTNQTAIDLARRLAELAPGQLNKMLFAPGGTNAIGMALKLARYATGGTKPFRCGKAFTVPHWMPSRLAGKACSERMLGRFCRAVNIFHRQRAENAISIAKMSSMRAA